MVVVDVVVEATGIETKGGDHLNQEVEEDLIEMVIETDQGKKKLSIETFY